MPGLTHHWSTLVSNADKLPLTIAVTVSLVTCAEKAVAFTVEVSIPAAAIAASSKTTCFTTLYTKHDVSQSHCLIHALK